MSSPPLSPMPPRIAGAEPDRDPEATDSDPDLAPSTCPLCALEEVLPETACTLVTDNAFLRRIMSQELLHYGLIPDHVLYTNIARDYNRHIRGQLRRAGVDTPRWTREIVRRHFELHVALLPRRVLGKQIALNQRLLAMLEKEVNAQSAAALASMNADRDPDFAPPPSHEFVDSKVIKKICDVQAKLLPMLERYRAFQREDHVATGVATLWRSVQLGDTTAQDAQALLASAAALRTSAGPGDAPMASELFE